MNSIHILTLRNPRLSLNPSQPFTKIVISKSHKSRLGLIVRMMREAGAKEVHFRISSPPITHPDFYGIDTPEKEKLLAATHDLEQMRQYIGADSLAFLSIEGVYRAMGETGRNAAQPQFTDHCFTGDYPTPLTDLAVATPRRLALLAEAD